MQGNSFFCFLSFLGRCRPERSGLMSRFGDLSVMSVPVQTKDGNAANFSTEVRICSAFSFPNNREDVWLRCLIDELHAMA